MPCAENCNPLFFAIFDENHIKRQVDGKGTVLILLLLKLMTKTSQLDDIAIVIYLGRLPVIKI